MFLSYKLFLGGGRNQTKEWLLIEEGVRKKLIDLRFNLMARVLSSDVLHLFIQVCSEQGKHIKDFFPQNAKDVHAALTKRVQRFLHKYNLGLRKTTNQSNTSLVEQGQLAAKFLRNNLRLQQDWSVPPENR